MSASFDFCHPLTYAGHTVAEVEGHVRVCHDGSLEIALYPLGGRRDQLIALPSSGREHVELAAWLRQTEPERLEQAVEIARCDEVLRSRAVMRADLESPALAPRRTDEIARPGARS